MSKRRGYVLTPAARQDLFDIQTYLRSESAIATERVMNQLRARMRDIAEMPGMGHRREDLTERNLRFLTVYRYHIVYRPDTNPIQIVRVIHGRRDLPRQLDE